MIDSVHCPKKMVFGPCGGVQQDGACEMRPHPCVFDEIRTWTLPAPPPVPVQVPLVLADLSAPPADRTMLVAAARIVAPHCDAVLVGDHQDRPDYPPTMLARMLAEAGAVPWVTLACRDRNRYGLEQELHGLVEDGLATVLCVTGDGRAFDVRPDVTQVFDLDGTRLAALAASLGLPVAVAETPTAPPIALRPGHLVQKQRAGAGVAVLNHVRTAADVGTFVAHCRAEGLTLPLLASVAVYTDVRSAAVLAALPGLELDQDSVDQVLAARDPIAAGIARAVAEAHAMLAVEGVAGVNLSGMASARGPIFAAEVQAAVGDEIRRGVAT